MSTNFLLDVVAHETVFQDGATHALLLLQRFLHEATQYRASSEFRRTAEGKHRLSASAQHRPRPSYRKQIESPSGTLLLSVSDFSKFKRMGQVAGEVVYIAGHPVHLELTRSTHGDFPDDRSKDYATVWLCRANVPTLPSCKSFFLRAECTLSVYDCKEQVWKFHRQGAPDAASSHTLELGADGYAFKQCARDGLLSTPWAAASPDNCTFLSVNDSMDLAVECVLLEY